MKLAQISKLEVKEKSRLFFKKISLLAFLFIFSVVNSIDTLKVDKDELTREDIFKKLQLVANASEPDSSSGGSDQPNHKDKNSIFNKKPRSSHNKKPRSSHNKKPRLPAYRFRRIQESGFSNTCGISFSNTCGSTKPSFKGEN